MAIAKTPKPKPVFLRLTPDLDKIVRNKAACEGETLSTILRSLIRMALAAEQSIKR